MSKIVINDTREIQLLDAIKNPNELNFAVGDKFIELTTDKSKTNGSPQLQFSKDGNEYYIREIFTVPVDKSIFSQTYSTNKSSPQTIINASVTITKAFTGRITVSGTGWWDEHSSYHSLTVSGVGGNSRIAGGYSFYKDVTDFSGVLNITGVVSWSTYSGHSGDEHYAGYLSVNIKTVGEEEI